MAEQLSAGAIGAEVARLHEQLRRNNFAVPAQEVRRKFFGPGTRETVQAYQRQHGLACSGALDESTAALLSGNPRPPAGAIANPARVAIGAANGSGRTARRIPTPRTDVAVPAALDSPHRSARSTQPKPETHTAALRGHLPDGAERFAGGGPGACPPADVDPSVSIRPVTGRVGTGIPFTITVDLDRGIHYEFRDEGPFGYCDEYPMVTYTELEIRVDGGGKITDHNGPFSGSVNETLTIATWGNHTLTATGIYSWGSAVSAPVTVWVGAGAPPAFTVVKPEAGATIDLDEAGKHVPVELSTTSDYGPFKATIKWDNQTTSETFSSPQYHRTTIDMASMPLGERTIEVTVADRDGQTSPVQPVTVIGRDAAPPREPVTVPLDGANVEGDANGEVTVRLEGTSEDTQSGMKDGAAAVEWALTPMGSRTAAHPRTGSDFTNWTANIPLAGFGSHTIYLWATDHAGNTKPSELQFVVISTYVPETLDERLNQRAVPGGAALLHRRTGHSHQRWRASGHRHPGHRAGPAAGPAQSAAVRGGRPRRPGGQRTAGTAGAAAGPHHQHQHLHGPRRRPGVRLPHGGLQQPPRRQRYVLPGAAAGPRRQPRRPPAPGRPAGRPAPVGDWTSWSWTVTTSTKKRCRPCSA